MRLLTRGVTTVVAASLLDVLLAFTTQPPTSRLRIRSSQTKDVRTQASKRMAASLDPTTISPEDVNGEPDLSNLLELPRHSSEQVNEILKETEKVLSAMHEFSLKSDVALSLADAKEAGRAHEKVYANNYVDLAKVDTVGFDFDYTLVTYTEELLELIYDMALKRLVTDKQYPIEMLHNAGLRFDPHFSIRGLAVDTKTGWICHLSYTHKVAVAWEGREQVPTPRIYSEYRGKRGMTPSERRKRLKPLNDIFSMSECCLIADSVQFFKDRQIPYHAQNIVTDVLSAIGETHISGDFHRIVAENPDRYFETTPHLTQVVHNFKDAGKRLLLVSNSPFWYVDAGMRHLFGNDWTMEWDAIITSAGKPNFYTDDSRPFREICQETRRPLFRRVDRFEKGSVYTGGCIQELQRLVDWTKPSDPTSDVHGDTTDEQSEFGMKSGAVDVATANVLYIGDSLFADLVDAKREFSWTTAAVTPEVGYELEIQAQNDFTLAQRTIDLLLNALRNVQEELGTAMRSDEDIGTLDALEKLVSKWRDQETRTLGNPFGSVFRARYQPSLFAHSLRRYCDLYMPSVSCFRNYSPQHRFYPEQHHKLLSHEMVNADCWDLDEVMECTESGKSLEN
mmetsp:Transcript_5081/g.6626  ORF Transcript_5081/g.6626 Transcript_5081/m.6626 type:complete len:621 (+) Transcript_5081:133-1995(+)|eukprot:CAMPEP_0198142936 /NCGR_PEP_ID=MMETSP1443-20131203/5592_1 /TAXON_ID=186043 /ORGANISM="Entomoneis sp., Strain CCMP2396" /LENGTH=620 /DNA_ID=CAMNT_0043806065 /DNA_START=83 /DNA_END=1945 /DNA_ORIENTATION=+